MSQVSDFFESLYIFKWFGCYFGRIMSSPPITNHAIMSDAQDHLAHVLWSCAAIIRGNVKVKTNAEEDAMIYDVDTALWAIWPDSLSLSSYVVQISDVGMYMRSTITSNNFNSIAWNVLKQLKSLIIKYETSWRRNYAHNLHVIDLELGQLEAWHIRVIAKVEQVTMRTRALLTVLPEDVLAPIVQLAAEADTPL